MEHMDMSMNMTHYMELLATNQPWNLIIFMAIPVILAEYIAVSELFILLRRNLQSGIKQLNRWAGIAIGVYFLGVFLYLLFTAFIPLTMSGQWRGLADVIAVSSYLLGVVPLGGIALLELGFIGKQRNEERKLQLHVSFVAVFLVVAHIAMIFGMLDPRII